MAILVSPDSAEGIERLKWETPKSQGGMRCNGYEEYPKAMHKAGRPTHGNVMLTESVTAHSADQEAVLRGQGWHASPLDAINAVHQDHVEHSRLAAERHFTERTMSEPAQREAAAVDASTVYHVPAIPETPIRRRMRPTRKPEGGVS